MSMPSKAAVFLLGGCLGAWAQGNPPRPQTRLKIDFPGDSPVAVVSADWGESRETARGSALVLDLRTALSLRNTSQRRIRGITLMVLAQAVTPGGKASVTVPSLDVKPGETFPIRIDLRLLRPQGGTGPLVEIDLDGVLFDDLSFYGANRLNSRRLMTVWEVEARRDRRYYKSILEARGAEALQREILQTLARVAEYPKLDVQVSRRGRATAVAAREREQEYQFAFLNLPDSPLEPLRGGVQVAGDEARTPRIEVLNRSSRPIRYFEIGWILKDRQGREYLAGSVPASDSGFSLAPGQKSEILQDVSLRFSRSPGQPLAIDGMTGFVSQAEFADGAIWIPERAALNDPRLQRILPPSAEEQRLADLYRKKGLGVLIEELKKF